LQYDNPRISIGHFRYCQKNNISDPLCNVFLIPSAPQILEFIFTHALPRLLNFVQRFIENVVLLVPAAIDIYITWRSNFANTNNLLLIKLEKCLPNCLQQAFGQQWPAALQTTGAWSTEAGKLIKVLWQPVAADCSI
jgi:hypothetical protein